MWSGSEECSYLRLTDCCITLSGLESNKEELTLAGDAIDLRVDLCRIDFRIRVDFFIIDFRMRLDFYRIDFRR